MGDHGTSLFLYQLPEKNVLNILPIADCRLTFLSWTFNASSQSLKGICNRFAAVKFVTVI